MQQGLWKNTKYHKHCLFAHGGPGQWVIYIPRVVITQTDAHKDDLQSQILKKTSFTEGRFKERCRTFGVLAKGHLTQCDKTAETENKQSLLLVAEDCFC